MRSNLELGSQREEDRGRGVNLKEALIDQDAAGDCLMHLGWQACPHFLFVGVALVLPCCCRRFLLRSVYHAIPSYLTRPRMERCLSHPVKNAAAVTYRSVHGLAAVGFGAFTRLYSKLSSCLD